MVDIFKTDLRQFIFESGIDLLLSAYHSASRALATDVAEIEGQLAAYRQSGMKDYDLTEEGDFIRDREQELEEEIDMAREAYNDLRKGFALLAYHHWERAAQKWTKASSNIGHDKLVKMARAKGIEPHPRLSAVRDLANTIKHNSEKFGQQLVKSWPEVFPPRFSKPIGTDWYGAISLTDDHIEEAFAIILESGPSPRWRKA